MYVCHMRTDLEYIACSRINNNMIAGHFCLCIQNSFVHSCQSGQSVMQSVFIDFAMHMPKINSPVINSATMNVYSTMYACVLQLSYVLQ